MKAGKIILFILIVILALNLLFVKIYSPVKVTFGVTFSPGYAGYLGLDFKKTYIAILDQLQVKNLRIPTYWDIVEPQAKEYDFSQTDYMLDEAGKRGAKVILVLGLRQPRWPECHIPSWAKNLTVSERKQKVLQFVQKVAERYQNHSVIWAWQIENEPLLGSFGEGCDAPDKDFLKEEVKLVRSLSNKTIIMTDSGELGFWVTSMQLSDIFGTTLYRYVYTKLLGYVTYPLMPYFYNVKSGLIRNLFAPKNQKTIIVELQSEPWLAEGNFVSTEKQYQLFSMKDFKNYVDFSRKTGFDEVYLWGVEWWYFMAQNGNPQYLDYAKMLFR